jgi:NAD(P)-dependent dehydrogenase (short-subunit alcohol dehydrogenase family)
MTKALALEWARYGIRVNALAPGYFETELNDEFFQEAAGQAHVIVADGGQMVSTL